MTNRNKDANAGCLIGAAIGDAMGHPTEFIRISDSSDGRAVTDYTKFWGPDDARFAPYTDDTQMAEATLRGLLDAPDGPDGELDTLMTTIRANYIEWSSNPQGGHRAPGGECLAACQRLKDPSRPWHLGGRNPGPRTGGGCGSVMRAHVFGMVYIGDMAAYMAAQHSRLSHRHDIALAACAAMALGVSMQKDKIAPLETAQMMEATARIYCESTAQCIKGAIANALNPNSSPARFYAAHEGWDARTAIAAAVYCFIRNPDDLRAAVLEGANTPGDSDSIASMAGALVGARVGLSGIPTDLVDRLERTTELQALAARCEA